MVARKITCNLVITLHNDCKRQSKVEMAKYIKTALLEYSGCFDPDNDPLFCAIEAVQVKDLKPIT